MKDSGIEWMGEIPNHWGVVKLNHKYKFHTGFTPDTKNEDYYSVDGFDWLTIGDLTDERVVFESAKKITNQAVENSKGTISTKGSLLYSFKLSVGQVAIAGKDIYTNEAIATFPIEKNPCVNFLYYSSQVCIVQNAIENIYGAKILNQELIKSAKLPFPPLHEQQAIASYLDNKVSRLDRLIQDQQQVIEDWKAYKQSLITETVTKGLNPEVELKDSGIEWIGEIPSHWEVKKIKKILLEEKASIRVGPFGSQLKGEDFKKEGYPVYNQKVVLSNNFEVFDSFVDENKFKQLTSFVASPGEALITTRGSIGKLAVIPDNAPEGIIHPCIIKARFNTSLILNDLLVYLFNFTSIVAEQLVKASNSTIIDVVYSEPLKNIYLPIPPLHEQQQIADFLDEKCSKIDQLIEDKQRLIEELKAYKQSLIYECVTGKKEIV